MPDAITTAQVQQYKANTELLLQQENQRLREAVTVGSYVGKQASIVEQFGEATAVEKTNRHADTPLLDVPQERRWVFPRDYEWASLIDAQDKLRLIIEPTSPYARAGAGAMARAMDDEILDKVFGTNYTGETGTTSESFSADYEVGVDIGGTASNLNVAKLQKGLRLLMTAHKGDVTEPVSAAISSYEHDSLLKEVQVHNKDYGGTAVLVDGRVRRFLGTNFILTERLNIVSGDRLIPMWVKSGMHFGIWQDLMVRVSERADKSHAWQVYLCGTFGATRTQPGKVIKILCDDLI